MKILFIYTNIDGFHEDTYSLGLASIVSMARVSGHISEVVIIKTKREYRRVLDKIDSFDPNLVGFSSVSSQFGFVKELAVEIKSKNPDVTIVCGGVHPTINPQCLLESESLDAVFVGEAENSFIEFVDKLEKKENFFDVDNLAYIQNGKLVLNKLKPLISNLDEVPYPDREIYPFEETLRSVGHAPFFFSRGCPYLCSYCSNHAIADRYGLPRNFPRYRSVESGIREIEYVLSKFSVERNMIGDDIFGIDRQWREEFCRQYKRRIKTKFQCLLRANLVDEDFIRMLKEAGCYRVSIGVESGNEFVRNTIMNRQMSNEQIIKAFDLAHKYGLQTTAINIIGVPGETEKMIKDTIRLNRRIKPTSSGINIFYPYKGTKLGDICFKDGLVDEACYNDFSKERRQTILNYPRKHKKKLCYYRENWEVLIYPFDFKKRLAKLLRKTFIWKYLQRVKRFIIVWIEN